MPPSRPFHLRSSSVRRGRTTSSRTPSMRRSRGSSSPAPAAPTNTSSPAPAASSRSTVTGGEAAPSRPRDTLHLEVMEPLRKHMSSGVRVKEEMELEDGNDLLVKRRRTEVSGSIDRRHLQLEQKTFGKEKKAPDSLSVEDSTGKYPMNVLTSCAVQNSGQANGRSNKPATLRLLKICKIMCWKEPSYDYEEQGTSHIKMFKCKVTVHMDGLDNAILEEYLSNPKANTILECFSDPNPRKKAAKEHAAQGALWFLQRSGYAN